MEQATEKKLQMVYSFLGTHREHLQGSGHLLLHACQHTCLIGQVQLI